MSFASRQFAKSWINHYSRKDTNHHIKGSDSAANRRTLVVVPFSVVIDDRLGDGRLDTFTTMADIELDLNTAANWDTVTPTNYAAYLAYQTYADRIVEELPGSFDQAGVFQPISNPIAKQVMEKLKGLKATSEETISLVCNSPPIAEQGETPGPADSEEYPDELKLSNLISRW